MWTFVAGLLTLSLGISATSFPRGNAGAPTARVKNGTYEGVYSPEYDQDFFLGVPFAQPPVNDLRFRLPQSLNATWEGTRDAKDYSLLCVGYGVSSREQRAFHANISSLIKHSTTSPKTACIST